MKRSTVWFFSGPPQRLAPILWALAALFALRVVGQALVAFSNIKFLPPMEQWHSGLVPYPYLLPAQLFVLALIVKVSFDFSMGSGFFVHHRRVFGREVLYFGYLYLATMLVRYPLTMWLHPELRWLGKTIPIFFHWVLALYVICFGLWHRAQSETRP